MKNKYGYKVCYREFGKRKLKIHLICNSYDLCVWEIQYYENNPQYDRKTSKLIESPKWYLIPIKTFIEYNWLWRGCPF
ncbi:MAG: hypothetical protein RR247_02710 [Clostridia bacterium]